VAYAPTAASLVRAAMTRSHHDTALIKVTLAVSFHTLQQKERLHPIIATVTQPQCSCPRQGCCSPAAGATDQSSLPRPRSRTCCCCQNNSTPPRPNHSHTPLPYHPSHPFQPLPACCACHVQAHAAMAHSHGRSTCPRECCHLHDVAIRSMAWHMYSQQPGRMPAPLHNLTTHAYLASSCSHA
jgi:hypothetical protein